MNRKSALLGLIAFGLVLSISIWYIMQRQAQPKATRHHTNSHHSASARAPQSQADYKGQATTSAKQKFSITIPNGWQTVFNCSTSDTMFVSDSTQNALNYNEANPPIIKTQVCGDDSPKVFFVTVNAAPQAEPAAPNAAAFTTTSGLIGTRHCQNNVTVNGVSSRTVLTECTYRFEHKGSVYSINYTRPDQTYTDRTELIDRVAKSLAVL